MYEIAEHPVNKVIRQKNERRAAEGKPLINLIKDQMVCRVDGVNVGYLNIGRKSGIAFFADVDENTQREFERMAADIVGSQVTSSIAPTWTDPVTGEENEPDDY